MVRLQACPQLLNKDKPLLKPSQNARLRHEILRLSLTFALADCVSGVMKRLLGYSYNNASQLKVFFLEPKRSHQQS